MNIGEASYANRNLSVFPVGIEPTTYLGCKPRALPAELREQYWWKVWGSNPRPLACDASTHSGWANLPYVLRVGVEPTYTITLLTRVYKTRGIPEDGGESGIQTHDFTVLQTVPLDHSSISPFIFHNIFSINYFVRAEGVEPPMFTLWEQIYSLLQHHHRCRTLKIISGMGQIRTTETPKRPKTTRI